MKNEIKVSIDDNNKYHIVQLPLPGNIKYKTTGNDEKYYFIGLLTLNLIVHNSKETVITFRHLSKLIPNFKDTISYLSSINIIEAEYYKGKVLIGFTDNIVNKLELFDTHQVTLKFDLDKEYPEIII